MSLANECDSEALTQGLYCSPRWMYMFILHLVLHHSSRLAMVPWSNSVAHMFYGVMGWLPLPRVGMNYSSPIWYCGWSSFHWYVTKTFCNFRPIERCLTCCPSTVANLFKTGLETFLAFYLWPCVAQRKRDNDTSEALVVAVAVQATCE